MLRGTSFVPVCSADHWRTVGVGPVSAKGHQGATGEIVGITWPTLVLGEVEPT